MNPDKIYYEKVGRKYKPVHHLHHFDSDLLRMPEGFHLIYACTKTGRTFRWNINPDMTDLVCKENFLTEAIIKQSEEINYEWRLTSKPKKLTKKQKEAWESLKKSLGPILNISGISYHELISSAVKKALANL